MNLDFTLRLGLVFVLMTEAGGAQTGQGPSAVFSPLMQENLEKCVLRDFISSQKSQRRGHPLCHLENALAVEQTSLFGVFPCSVANPLQRTSPDPSDRDELVSLCAHLPAMGLIPSFRSFSCMIPFLSVWSPWRPPRPVSDLTV